MNGSASEAHRRHGHKHSTNNRGHHIRECRQRFRLPQQLRALNRERRKRGERAENAGSEKRVCEKSRRLAVKKQHEHHADQRGSYEIDRKGCRWERS